MEREEPAPNMVRQPGNRNFHIYQRHVASRSMGTFDTMYRCVQEGGLRAVDVIGMMRLRKVIEHWCTPITRSMIDFAAPLWSTIYGCQT